MVAASDANANATATVDLLIQNDATQCVIVAVQIVKDDLDVFL